MPPQELKKRIVQLLGMLGSDHDGEILNAARLAQRELTNHKLSWGEFFNGVSSSASAYGFGAANRAEVGEARRAGWYEGWQAGRQLGRQETVAEYEEKIKALGKKHRAELDQKIAAAVERRQQTARRKAKESARSAGSGAWKDLAHHILAEYEDRLDDWECSFFKSFAVGVRLSPTEKQYAKFCQTAQRLGIELPEYSLERVPLDEA